MLINSIAAFHYAADLDHHAGEGFHLHADEQLFVGLSEKLKDHHMSTDPDSGNTSYNLQTDSVTTAVSELASEEHDDGSHVHLQLESMPAQLEVYASQAPDILHSQSPVYLSQAFSPPVPPPTA